MVIRRKGDLPHPMAETRRKFDRDFKEGAVPAGPETGKPIAQVARDLGINEGTLGELAWPENGGVVPPAPVP
jgi:transposase-like protein